MDGWIKLHRKITESAIFSDPDMLRLWILCLSKATHKSTKVLMNGIEIHLHPGEFIIGRLALTEEFNRGLKPRKKVSDSTLWRWLLALENAGNLNIKKTNKYSIVAVVKWSEYQENEHHVEQQMNNKWTTDEQQMNTNKNVKNDKNERNKNTRHKKTYDEDSSYFKMAKYLYDKVMEKAEQNSTAHLVRDADLQKWSDTCRLILDTDKRDRAEVKKVIDWAVEDEFWQVNMLSPSSLRKNYVKIAAKALTSTSISSTHKKHSSRTEKNMEILNEFFWEEEEREQKGNGSTSSHSQPYLL